MILFRQLGSFAKNLNLVDSNSQLGTLVVKVGSFQILKFPLSKEMEFEYFIKYKNSWVKIF